MTQDLYRVPEERVASFERFLSHSETGGACTVSRLSRGGVWEHATINAQNKKAERYLALIVIPSPPGFLSLRLRNLVAAVKSE